jgi:hypothetical protein
VRFLSLINTILKQHVYQMVLHRPIESTALIRQVERVSGTLLAIVMRKSRLLKIAFAVIGGVILICCLFPLASGAQERSSSAAPSAISNLALRYLQSIHDTNSYDSLGSRGEDFVFVGTSRPPSGGWRIIVVRARSGKPRLIWDSYSLPKDNYLMLTSPREMDSDADGSAGYVITMRGCARHQCADGRIGFALYASRTDRTYVSHITTRDDGSYVVTYYPKLGMLDTYRDKLDRMMCSDGGISRPFALPIKCLGK